MMKRSYGMCRVSTINQEHNTSIKHQREKISQYSNLNNFNLVDVITDVCSGAYETRNGIEEIKSLIDDGKVDVVLIWNTSRAFRSMIAFSKFYEYLKTNSVELISVSEGIRSSRKEGEMMFGIMCSISAYEKELIRERMMSGRYMKVKSGVRGFGSKLPFGYCKNTDGEIVLDEANSKVVQYIFRKMNSLLKNSKLTKSKRTRRLLKLLQDRNFTYNGKPFTRWNVRDILNNTFYFGELKYGEIKTNHNYEPIISKRLFNQVCVG